MGLDETYWGVVGCGWVGVEEKDDRYYRSAVSGGMMEALPKIGTGCSDNRGWGKGRGRGKVG